MFFAFVDQRGELQARPASRVLQALAYPRRRDAATSVSFCSADLPHRDTGYTATVVKTAITCAVSRA
jgi:hypothetical protein